jgi:hypothetical protein
MTLNELNTSINTLLSRVGSNRITGSDILTAVQQVISYFATQISEIIPEWEDTLTFQTDGSDAGKYCVYPDTNGKQRIWETLDDDNINNLPPSNPATTSNAFWSEVSASATAAIPEWAAGIYGPGLVIVFHNHTTDGRGLYALIEPTRPYASTNIETEITAGDWERIGGTATGTGGPAIDEEYANIAAMLADQANQEQDALYFVSDASADATVDADWALYQKLAASTAAIGDYRKLSEKESLDVVLNVLGTALTGLTSTAGTITSADTILSAFGKVVYFISNIYTSIRDSFSAALSAKTTPVDADGLLINDSADSNKLKLTTLTNFKAFLKTYNDSLYPNILVTHQTKTADYTLLSGDLTNTSAGKVLHFLLDSASSKTLTIPPNSDVAFPVGTVIFLTFINTGGGSFVAGSGVTFNTADGTILSTRYKSAYAEKIATNTWLLNGALTT